MLLRRTKQRAAESSVELSQCFPRGRTTSNICLEPSPRALAEGQQQANLHSALFAKQKYVLRVLKQSHRRPGLVLDWLLKGGFCEGSSNTNAYLSMHLYSICCLPMQKVVLTFNLLCKREITKKVSRSTTTSTKNTYLFTTDVNKFYVSATQYATYFWSRSTYSKKA